MTPVDLTALAAAYGPPGLIIAVLMVVIRALYLRNVEVQDKRIEDWKAQSDQLRDSIRMLDRARDVLEARRDA